jgi:hypothetical protein
MQALQSVLGLKSSLQAVALNMLVRLGYSPSGNYVLSTRLQKLSQTVVIGGPLAVLLFLHAPWMPGRSGMFDYALRQYSKGSKRRLSDGKRRMVRGPSVFFDSEDFRALSSELDPRGTMEPDTVWVKYQQWCKRHALVTKAVTAAVLAILGDVLVQYLRTRDKRRELAKLSVEALLELRPSLGTGLFPLHQPMQTAAFALHGLVLAPLGHVWYAALEKLSGGVKGSRGLALRVVLDRLIYDPLQLLATLFILGKLTGPSPATVLGALADPSASTVFWVSLFANWRVWLPAQLLNYALVPPHLRVLFGNGVSFVWNWAMALRFATGLTAA